jgi:hypothetical protein
MRLHVRQDMLGGVAEGQPNSPNHYSIVTESPPLLSSQPSVVLLYITVSTWVCHLSCQPLHRSRALVVAGAQRAGK